MSVGLQMLRAVIDNGSREVFRTLTPNLFTEDEQPAWRFVNDYFSRYGGLPSQEVLAENQIWLPQATGAVEYHRQQLRRRTIYNAYVQHQQQLSELLISGQSDEFLSLLEQVMANMRATAVQRDTYTLADALDMVIADFEEAQRISGLRGVTYGWPSLDDRTGGARNGDLHTIVARPGVGKSFTITRMACSAWEAGASVVFVSNEMSAIETARRILAMGSGVNADFIQRGHVSAWGEEQIRATVSRVGDMPPFHLLIGDLSKSARDVDALIQEHEPDAVYVDAGYLMRPSKDRGLMKRFEVASETMRELRGLATQRNKPIIQTVQFNRAQKDDEEMSLGNIGQTDEVGQLSALVLGMKKGSAPREDVTRTYRIIKNRHGPDTLSFTTHFLHSPFNMDEVAEDDGDGTDENGDWDGEQRPAPPMQEWNA